MKTENDSQCPRCGEGRLRAWHELDDEEHVVVGRLPASADYTLDERKRTHLWCKRCWYEATGGNATEHLT
jgi:ribosomal protein L37E